MSVIAPIGIFTGALDAPREAGLLWTSTAHPDAALTEGEHADAARLIAPQAQQNRRAELASRRQHLAHHLDVQPADLAIDYHPGGQPFLPDFPGLSLSTSHSGGWSALAVAQSRAVGLDIERVRPLDWPPMLAMICDEAERAAFLSSQPNLPEFFRLWTIKEAVLKATGQGFRAGPKAVQIPIQHLRQTSSQFALDAHGARYQIETTSHDEITLAIALTRDRPPPRTSV